MMNNIEQMLPFNLTMNSGMQVAADTLFVIHFRSTEATTCTRWPFNRDEYFHLLGLNEIVRSVKMKFIESLLCYHL